MNPSIFLGRGVIGPGSLNQLPTLGELGLFSVQLVGWGLMIPGKTRVFAGGAFVYAPDPGRFVLQLGALLLRHP